MKLPNIIKKRWLIYLAVIVLGILILISPILTDNTVYKNIALGGDTEKVFIPLMNLSHNGASLTEVNRYSPYLGLSVVMWILGKINLNHSIVFYYYSMMVLLAAGVSLFFFGKVIGGESAGWTMLIMGMLCSTTIISLITVGCTVNIINVYIILIWAIVLFIKWQIAHRWYFMASALGLSVIFLILHPTGAYLPATLMVMLVVTLIWAIYKRKWSNWWFAGLGIAIASFYFKWHSITISAGTTDLNLNIWAYNFKNLILFLVPAPTAIAILSVIAWAKNKKQINFNNFEKYILVILGCLAISLIGASVLRITIVPQRQIVDASAMLAIMTAIVMSKIIREQKVVWLKSSAYALMLLGSLITIQAWIR